MRILLALLLLAQLTAKATDPIAVVAAYAALPKPKDAHANPTLPAPAIEPDAGPVSLWWEWLKGLTQASGLFGTIILGLKLFRKIRAWSGSPTLLDEGQFQTLIDFLEGLQAKVDAIPTNPTPPASNPSP